VRFPPSLPIASTHQLTPYPASLPHPSRHQPLR
jgi:hypothetical protein